MKQALPSRDFLASQVRLAMGRGLPAQVAEDVVFEAWEKASKAFDPKLGNLEAYMQRIVRNDCAYYWRTQQRAERMATQLKLVSGEDGASELAADRQEAFLAALSDEERAVFAAWALQKHLGKGQVTSKSVGASLGLSTVDFENAKRRLKTRLVGLLGSFGWTVQDLLNGGDDVERAH
jgi:hypothetical protein